MLAALPGQTALLDSSSWEPCALSLLGDEGAEVAGGCVVCADGGQPRDGRNWLLRAAAFQPIVRVWRLAPTGVASRAAHVDVVDDVADWRAEAAVAAGGYSVLPTHPPQRDSPLARALAAEMPPVAGTTAAATAAKPAHAHGS